MSSSIDPSLLKPYSRLIKISVLGTVLEVPENNSLLRCFQYLCPTTVPYGKFCWNSECGNSKFYYRLAGETTERKARACWFQPQEGMEITVLSAELKYVLRAVLGPSNAPTLPGGDDEDDADEIPIPRFKSD